MSAASSIIYGDIASPVLAERAVRAAMQKLNITTANCVLLFLSTEFANNPQPAIKAAARAANCTQIIGCTASGIFTEEDWVLDAPAAAVMVFTNDVQLETFNPANISSANHNDNQALLTMTAPNAINSTWLNNGHARYGGVSGDALGQGAFSVWQHAKGEARGFVEVQIKGVQVESMAAHGLRALASPQQITKSNGYDVLRVAQQHTETSAYVFLEKAWHLHHKQQQPLALHQCMAMYADSLAALENGDYQQTNCISVDEQSQSVTLAQPLKAGQWLNFGLRDAQVAAAEFTLTCDALKNTLSAPPAFGLLFSCLGRGPYFYGGIDRDLKIIQETFPNMPLLGFYGNGEIAYIQGMNQLLPYSAVLSVFCLTKNKSCA